MTLLATRARPKTAKKQAKQQQGKTAESKQGK
jgi:hypothetical protein